MKFLKGEGKYPIEYTIYTFSFDKSKNESIYLILSTSDALSLL